MKKLMTASRASILSAILTSACCLPVLILLALGLSSVTLGATLAKYHWWFFGSGSMLLGYSYFLYFRDKRACSTRGCARPQQGLTVLSLAIGTAVVLGFAANSVLPILFRGERISPARAAGPDASSAAITIPVEGMTCFSCELHVKKVVGEISGVKQVMASATAGTVKVVYDPGKIMSRDLVDAINSKTHYKATAPLKPDATIEKGRDKREREGMTAHE